MALRLRSAQAGDAGAILALHLASWRDVYRGLLDPDFLAAPVEEALGGHWRSVFSSHRRPGALILATAGREAAGFVVAWHEGADCYVDNLHVRPGMRGAGIGRALLGLAARRLAAGGATSASLTVFAGNAGAIRFYAALGAEIGPEVTRQTFGQVVPERELRWPSIGKLIRACATAGPR